MDPAAFILPEDGWFHIAAFGEWPHKPTGLTQVIDEVCADEIIKAFTEFKAAPNWPGVLIDFDHQSLDIDKPTVAAGWIGDLQKRDSGLWAKIRWSDLGRQSIEGGRYRFISPVWRSSDCAKLDGDRIRPLKLMNCAVTNDPNIKGLFPLSNADKPTRFSAPAREILPAPSPKPAKPPPLPAFPIPMAGAVARAVFIRNRRNQKPLTRQQEIAIILKDKRNGGGGGQGPIGGAKTESKENQVDPTSYGFLEDPAEISKTQNYRYVPLSEAVGRAKTLASMPTNNIAEINASLSKWRKDRIAKRTAHKKVPTNSSPQKNPPSEKSLTEQWEEAGWIYNAESGYWEIADRKMPNGIRRMHGPIYDSAKSKYPAEIQMVKNSGPTVDLGQQTYSPDTARTQYIYTNRGRRVGGILANYAVPAGRDYTKEQLGAIFAWYAGGRTATGRDSAGRIANYQSEIDALEAARPTKPDDPMDFSLIDVAEVKRQAMAVPGYNSGDVLAAVAEAEATNKARKSAWASLKRKIKKQYKSKPQRERALARELGNIQKAYKTEMANWEKGNAKIDKQIAALRSKIAEEEIRQGEATTKQALKDADRAQADLRSIKKDEQREKDRERQAAIEEQNRLAKEALREANKKLTPEQQLQLEEKARNAQQRINKESVQWAVNYAIAGNIDEAMKFLKRLPQATKTDLASDIAKIRAGIPEDDYGVQLPNKVKTANAEIKTLIYEQAGPIYGVVAPNEKS